MKPETTIAPEELRDIKQFWSQLLACHQLAILSIYACEVLILMARNPAVADIINKAPGGGPSWAKSVNDTRLKQYEVLPDWLHRMSTSSADAIFDNNGHLAATLVLLSNTVDEESGIDKGDPYRLVTWSLMSMSRAVRIVCESLGGVELLCLYA